MAAKSALALRKADAVDEWAVRITAAMNQTVEGIFAVGRELTEAKAALEHGQWLRLFEEERVAMAERTAQRYLAIWKARDRLLPKATHVSLLPPSYATLYDLQALPEDTLEWAIKEGKVTPELQRKDVKALRTAFDGVTLPTAPKEQPHLSLRVQAATKKFYAALDRALKDWPADPPTFADVLLTWMNSHPEFETKVSVA